MSDWRVGTGGSANSASGVESGGMWLLVMEETRRDGSDGGGGEVISFSFHVDGMAWPGGG